MRTGYPLRASALLGLVALLTLSGGASGAVPAAKAKPANGPIGALAMDGARVAYDVVGNLPRRCNRVRVWNVLTGASRIASGRARAAPIRRARARASGNSRSHAAASPGL